MQIIALGGRGFTSGSRDAALDRYVLAQIGKRRPRVCFVPTASGDSAAYVRRVAAAVKRAGGVSSCLSLFAPPAGDLSTYLCKHDVVFVGGGNTRNLLALWKLWGLDKAMRKAYERGIILSGVSAGAICWFQAGLTDSWTGKYRELDALGWLRGSFSPHFDSEPRRRAIYRRLIHNGTMPGGYAVDDGVALHFVGGKLVRAVSSRRRAEALEIRRRGDRLIETALLVGRLS
jgi:peptidase E